jgi:hypothetical protein
MKNVLRAFGLAGALVLVMAASGQAADNCAIQCSDGSTYSFTTSTAAECCQLFGNVCGSMGSAVWTRPTGGVKLCPSIAP